ncbi:MAG: trypsin-like peptidase domain-containing protein [Gemmatimonadota bacterium]|nr:trypsin-like peptidase domain-containing protein [Gemmatimonadota bacterium]
MNSDLKKSIGDLEEAVRLLDRPVVANLSMRLAALLYRQDDPLPLADAKRILNQLRRKRYFAQMQIVADALLQTGQTAPVVHRQYAQSLIDQGQLTAADAVLRELVRDPIDDPDESIEARGLLGRVRKQRYVEARRTAVQHERVAQRDAAVLLDAIDIYQAAYEEAPDKCLWHGIDAVACLARANRDGIDVTAAPRTTELAQNILARVTAQGGSAPCWDVATALEACVALGQRHAAMGWALDYVQRDDADAFEIASTLRQLTEVWQLTGTGGDGETLLPILRDGLLRRATGQVDLTAAEARMSNTQLEKVLGHDAFVTLRTYTAGLDRARLVARIGLDTDRGEGTGFLVRGSDLAKRFGDEWLLLTNAHVVSKKDEHRPAVRPDEAVISFETHPQTTPGQIDTYGVAEVVWESGPNELDTSIIRLNRSVDAIVDRDRCDIAPGLPLNDEKQHVYIIGHPGGGILSFSLQDNLLLDYEDPRLHYRTPTKGGSSGSPIFNAQWKLIGIHHAGDTNVRRLNGRNGTYAANEGIWLQSIRRAIASA